MVLVTQSVEEFRQVAPIAASAGLGVVNGGYVYDRELVHRLPEVRPGVTVADLDPETVSAHLDTVDPAAELAAAAFLARARAVCDKFDTRRGAALVPAGRRAGDAGGQPRGAGTSGGVRSPSADADELWAGILGRWGPRRRGRS